MLTDITNEHKQQFTAWLLGGIPVIASFIQAINALLGNSVLYWIPVIGDISKALVSIQVFDRAAEIFYSQTAVIFGLFILIGLSWISQGGLMFTTAGREYSESKQATFGAVVLSGLLYGFLFLGVYLPIFSSVDAVSTFAFLSIPVVAVGSLFYAYYTYSWREIRVAEAVSDLKSAERKASEAEERVRNKVNKYEFTDTDEEDISPEFYTASETLESFYSECEDVRDESKRNIDRTEILNVEDLEQSARSLLNQARELNPDPVINTVEETVEEIEERKDEAISKIKEARKIAQDSRQQIEQKSSELGLNDSSLTILSVNENVDQFVEDCENIEDEANELIETAEETDLDTLSRKAASLESRAEGLNKDNIIDNMEEAADVGKQQVHEAVATLNKCKKDVKEVREEFNSGIDEIPLEELNTYSGDFADADEQRFDTSDRYNELVNEINDLLDSVEHTDPGVLQNRAERIKSEVSRLDAEYQLDRIRTHVNNGLDKTIVDLSDRLETVITNDEGEKYNLDNVTIDKVQVPNDPTNQVDIINKAITDDNSLSSEINQVVEDHDLSLYQQVHFINEVDRIITEDISSKIDKYENEFQEIENSISKLIDQIKNSISNQDPNIKRKLEEMYLEGEYNGIDSTKDIEKIVDDAHDILLDGDFESAITSLGTGKSMAKEGVKALRFIDGVFIYGIKNDESKITTLQNFENYTYNFYNKRMFAILKPAIAQAYDKVYNLNTDEMHITVEDINDSEIEEEELQDSVENEELANGAKIEVKYLIRELQDNMNDKVYGGSIISISEIPEHITVQNPWTEFFAFVNDTEGIEIVTVPENFENNVLDEIPSHDDDTQIKEHLPNKVIEENEDIIAVGAEEDNKIEPVFEDLVNEYSQWAN